MAFGTQAKEVAFEGGTADVNVANLSTGSFPMTMSGNTAAVSYTHLLTERKSLSRAFLFYKTPLSETEVQRSLFFVSGDVYKRQM